jgi:hypothetical protein
VVEIKDATDIDKSSQGYSKRYHKLCNILSTERYILHIQELVKCCNIKMESSQWEN